MVFFPTREAPNDPKRLHRLRGRPCYRPPTMPAVLRLRPRPVDRDARARRKHRQRHHRRRHLPAARGHGGELGPTAPVAYLLCAVAMGLIVLCMAEAGSRVSLTGGPYAYVEIAFGPLSDSWPASCCGCSHVRDGGGRDRARGQPRRARAGAGVARGVGRRVRRHLCGLRDGQYPRRRARRAREHSAHGRQDPAPAAAHRRRPFRDRYEQPTISILPTVDARPQQRPANLCVRRHRSGTGARWRGQGSGAHGAPRDFSSRWRP